METLSLEKLWQNAAETLKQKRLLIVCNTKMTSNNIIQGAFSLDSEYFSDDEFEQITAMFSSIGIPIDFFTYEDDFFRYILNLKESEKAKMIIYNAAQSGFGAGRKSLVPAFCNLHNLNCTGSNAYVASLCRHKFHVNKLLTQVGIRSPQTWLYSNGWLFNKSPSPGTKIILKPIYESASIGIDTASIQKYKPETDKHIQNLVKNQNQPIIAQEFISGYEVEVPQIRVGDLVCVLSPVGISVDGIRKLENDILDYKRIYFDQYEFYDFEKEFNCGVALSNCAADVASVLGMEGLCRVDFRIQSDGTFYVTDVSTNPHFVLHSSVDFAFSLIGLTSDCIVKTILSAAVMKG